MADGSSITTLDDQCVAALLAALHEKDAYTAEHSRKVAFYAEQTAVQLCLAPAMRGVVARAALLHDIGKLGVPDSILTKHARLTPLEQMLMDQVPAIGVRILSPLRRLAAETQIVGTQREQFDGSGVPDGASENEIPVGARIVRVADELDAMTTDPVYGARLPLEEALAELRRRAGTHFDPEVVAALHRALSTKPAQVRATAANPRTLSAPAPS